ncbi:putative pleckstrin homology domain-containing family H [Monocercomonoides exilis]|uniref:putative pleckstrin homology domain-containing family H n=1 Tax=Monocercomonoides exilis TaxID=2049356 RepID=UPI00355941A1|nr:putative pleckstrin homology domain-containing family H [Monocercomonoides exilis]|eukprot:MONOS_5821.1-p1 / transcript=MONOS_5821.1 / gene=MONOS_5821 / organism=Monocercomonoides_exilis_PA203 / gene_product=unspecified product / transcript_product=unspecified product / location=Mono_scaffold00174:81442-82914(-) / protein_length=315 / sequence_SO=supercontig / SO=protein_coding / is_pseudo=false
MTFTGWLTKEGGSFFKNWQRRWCVLDNQRGTLTYYESENTSKKPNGVVLLAGTTVALIAKSVKGKDNCFMISSPDRTFYAFADSASECDAWIAELRKVIESLAKQSDTPANATEETNDSTPDDTSLYAGWLTKEAGSGKNWRKRFFVLTKKEMKYYKDRSATEPQGSFPIAGATFVIPPQSYQPTGTRNPFASFLPTSSTGQIPFLFTIETGDKIRTYRLQARNAEEFKLWKQQIEWAIPRAGKFVPSMANTVKDEDDVGGSATASSSSTPSSAQPAQSSSSAPVEQEADDTEPDEEGAEREERFRMEIMRKVSL